MNAAWTGWSVPSLLEPFDRGDSFAVLHRSQGHTGKNAADVDMDGACSAFAPITGFLRTGQAEFITQRIE